ncbi:MAG: thioredoxin-disulfide reductase [Candidatus Micrarchaeia archaeon]
MPEKIIEKVIIIGSGPAGLSAAIYASREGFGPLVIAGSKGGGQLELTTVVENFPGFPDGVEGPEIVKLLKKQAEKFGTRFLDKDVEAVDLSQKPFKIISGNKEYYSDSLIIATGANAKWLGIPSEIKFIGKGVSSCGTCDGPFFKNKDVIVVGGGDTAMEDSIFLTKFANSVTIIHRKDTLKASKIMQERAMSNKKIKFIWNSIIEEILGDQKVSGVKIKNLITGEITEMKIDGVFVAIGYKPNTDIFKDQLKLDEKGYIETIDEVKTDIEGVYIAGDVADKFYRQAATASASGVKCALHVREYLSALYYNKEKTSKI